MNSLKALLIVVVLGLGNSQAHAADGKTLVERCMHAYRGSVGKETNVNASHVAWCYGYISATIDTANAYKALINAPRPFCPNEKFEMATLLTAIVGMGPSDQTSMEKSGAEMLINILRTLYPCR